MAETYKTMPKDMGYTVAAQKVWEHLRTTADGPAGSIGGRPGRLWTGNIAAAIYDLWPKITPADQRRASSEVRERAANSIIVVERGAGQKPSTMWVADEWRAISSADRQAMRKAGRPLGQLDPVDPWRTTGGIRSREVADTEPAPTQDPEPDMAQEASPEPAIPTGLDLIPAVLPRTEPDDIMEIKMANGAGVIYIGTKVNLFRLSDADAALISDLRKVFRAHDHRLGVGDERAEA